MKMKQAFIKAMIFGRTQNKIDLREINSWYSIDPIF